MGMQKAFILAKKTTVKPIIMNINRVLFCNLKLLRNCHKVWLFLSYQNLASLFDDFLEFRVILHETLGQGRGMQQAFRSKCSPDQEFIDQIVSVKHMLEFEF